MKTKNQASIQDQIKKLIIAETAISPEYLYLSTELCGKHPKRR
jgi:hypothetical protein